MKKLFLTFCVAVFLSISALPMTARANDGDAHDAGYKCTAGTPGCPPAAPNQAGAASGTSSNSSGGDSSISNLSFLDYVLSLLPKS